MKPRLAFRSCFAAGLLVLGLSLLSTRQPAPRPCGSLAKNYAPIIAFELARTASDLRMLFGEPGEACREPMITYMDSINLIDVWLFIPAYGCFLVCFFLGMRARDRRLGKLGVGISILAIAGDYAENLCLMQLTPDLDPSSSWLALLPWATGVKWAALGVAAALGGVLLIRGAPARVLVLRASAAILCWAALAVTSAALASPGRFGPWLSPAIGASWLVFLIASGVEAAKRDSVIEA